jgi:TonB-dependent starch-binding outer membrane protein SusC
MFIFSAISLSSIAQSVVSGTVTDSKSGAAVNGATVSVKGTTTATKTNASGAFSITAPANATLVISSVGYASQSVAVDGKTNFSVSLIATNQILEDVIVVAYGTKKKSDLTGSVVSIGQKDFQKGVVNSSEQLLQGKVAGLEVTTGGGAAGGGSKIRVRGSSSLNASNDPLIVIDGIAIDNNNVPGSANLLNTINPNDIESMSVLKDASAAALYGARATNGVIIITTKKGTAGKTRFNFNTKLNLGNVAKYVKVFSGDEVRSIINADAAASGSNSYKNQLGSSNTDWQKAIYQQSVGVENNLSASGTYKAKEGNFRLPFRASVGYLTQSGVLKTNKFERISSAFNFSPKFLKDNLSVNVNTKFTVTNNRFANEGAVGSALSFDPTQPVYSGKNKYHGYTEYLQANGLPYGLAPRNPLALLEQKNDRSTVSRILASAQLDYRLPFLKDMHVLLNASVDDSRGSGYNVVDSLAAEAYLVKGAYNQYKAKKVNSLLDLSLTYAKTIPSIKSKVDFLALHSYQDFNSRYNNYASYTGVQITPPVFEFDQPRYRIESYLGRVNYSYNDIFLLTGSIRRDAVSKFSKDNRVGYFPAAAAAIKLKELLFPNANKINELKIRGSWGVTGQQDGIDYYGYLSRYSLGNASAQYQLGNTFYQTARPSRYDVNLKWETTETANVGLDFGFASNRITGSFDVYQKKTKDLLSVVPVPSGANFDVELLTNVGNLENKGMEVALNFVPVRNKKITWEFGVNGSYNEAKITNLLKYEDPTFKGVPVNGISGGTGNQISRHAVGYAPYTFYTYKQVYDKVTGKPIQGLYEDTNRDGVPDSKDLNLNKHPNPDFLFGINTNITIAKWSIGAAAHGAVGNYLYNNFNSNNGTLKSVRNDLGYLGNSGVNFKETNFNNQQYLSDFYLENASFLRLDNINLGYNFGKIGKKNATLRLSGSVQNVLVITKYSGVDPESASNGVDNTIYPRPRIFSFGANIDF